MKFIYPIILYFLSSQMETTAAEENYPPLIVEDDYTPGYPELKNYSPNEEDKALAYGHNYYTPRFNLYYIFCPAWSSQEQALNGKSSSRRALFSRLEMTEYSFLDQRMPTCESPILPDIRKETYRGDKDRYTTGFEIFPQTPLRTNQVEIAEINEHSFKFSSRFEFRFDNTSKTVKSVQYYIIGRDCIPAGSNKGNTVAFHKNLDFLVTDVDDRYEHFRDHLLPRMTDEKSSHPTAHHLGIQKVSLIPSDDFLPAAWKRITYTDVITAPIWSILLFKWNAVEIFVRKLIRKLPPVLIINGVSETLDTVDNHYRPDDDVQKKLHVPKYVWKMVALSWTDKQAILIVMHNDPFSSETSKHECAEDCTKYGWLLGNDDYRTGLIYCCQVTAEIARRFDISLYEAKSEILDIINGSLSWYFKLSDVVFNPTEMTYDW